jgi:hypothetical protein
MVNEDHTVDNSDLYGSPVEYDDRMDLVQKAERILHKRGWSTALENQQYYDHMVPPLVDDR